MQRLPLVHRRGSGACQDTRRSNKPCATTISIHSVSPDCMSLFKLNPIEPPRYVTRMPGAVGGAAPQGVPLSRSWVIFRRIDPVTPSPLGSATALLADQL